MKPVRAEAAIVYDTRSDILSNIEKITGAAGEYEYKEGINGVYALFWHNNIPVDWLPSDGLFLDKISRYKVIYIPVPLIVDKELSAVFKVYVENGGVLISEASPGLREENGWVSPAIPCSEMEEVFGCMEVSRYQYEGINKLGFNLNGQETEISTDRIVTKLKVKKAEITGRWEDGTCAAAINSCGSGKAILLGTYLGGSYMKLREDETVRFFRQLLDYVGVRAPVMLEGMKGTVSVRCLEYGDKKVIAVINMGREDEVLKAWCDRKLNLSELFDSPCNFSVDGDILNLTIPAKQVLWLIEK